MRRGDHVSAIKERPILFSAPMVRAILDGRKTVTRRAVKIQPRFKGDIGSYGKGQPFIRNPDVTKPNPECPYGRPGDRLWLRETHFINDYREAKVPESDRAETEIVYRADPLPCWEGEESEISWRPSIFMPRWASRILLEITAVRVERLQDISDDQALAEGVRLYTDHAELGDWYHVEGIDTYSASPKKSFELLWSSINGADSWGSNPWCWAVEFKRVTP
jgi:hypothetical protein